MSKDFLAGRFPFVTLTHIMDCIDIMDCINIMDCKIIMLRLFIYIRCILLMTRPADNHLVVNAQGAIGH